MIGIGYLFYLSVSFTSENIRELPTWALTIDPLYASLSTFIQRHFLREKNIFLYGASLGIAHDRDRPYKNYEISSCRGIRLQRDRGC